MDGVVVGSQASGVDRLPPLVWRAKSWAQDTYHQLKHVTELLAEGNRYGGKTDALFMSFAINCERGYGKAWRGVIFRRTHKQLSDVIDRTRYWFDAIFAGRAVYNESKSEWVWKTGETLQFRYMDSDSDFSEYKGHAYTWIGWEELTLWPNDKAYKAMLSCLRSTFRGIPLQCRSTTNPGDVGHCVPYGEVMTPSGFVDIRDICAGDLVYSVTKDRRLIVAEVDQVHASRYSGPMMSFGKAGRDWMVFTPNHKIPLLNTAGDATEMREYVNLPGQANVARAIDECGWGGERLDRFAPDVVSTRRRRVAQPSAVTGDDFAELCGWMITEGYTVDRDKMFGIAQSKPAGRARIRAILDRCGFKYGESETSFSVYAPDWWAFFRAFGKSCNAKALPSWFLNIHRDQLRIFYDAAMMGDGCGRILYTQSPRLADQYQEIAFKIGQRVYCGSRQRANRDHRCFEISATRNADGSTWMETGQNVYDVGRAAPKRTNVRSSQYDGMVYCIGVPDTHSFVIRQNGYVWISGNSWVKRRFCLPEKRNQVFQIEEENPVTKKKVVRTIGSVFFDYTTNKTVMETDPDYVTRSLLPAARSAAERRAWAFGDWNIPAGGIFDEAWAEAERHIVLPTVNRQTGVKFEPRMIPTSWRIFRAYDDGESSPFSVGWWARSDGTDLVIPGLLTLRTLPKDMFRIGEWYGWSGQENEGLRMLKKDISAGIIAREVAWGLTEQLRSRVNPGPADSVIFDEEQGQSVAGNMAMPVRVDGKLYPGARFFAADKRPGSRIRGWDACRELMLGSVREPGRTREKPGLFVFDCCDQFLRTIPSLPRSKEIPDDADTDAEDHIADEFRYAVTSASPRLSATEVSGH